MSLTCKGCKKPMTMVYDVLERETVFVLWECGCGHKELERRPAGSRATASSSPALVGAGVGVGAIFGAGAGSGVADED